MITPTAQFSRHGLAPVESKLGAWLARKQRIADGGLAAEIRLATRDERMRAQSVGKAFDENRVDVGIDSAMLDQRIQTNEIGVMGVLIDRRNAVVVLV